MDTQPSSEPRLERSVEASGQIVLECSGCGEEMFLLGLDEDWPKEHRDSFGCACGKTVTLARPGRWDSLRRQKGATGGQHQGSPRRCVRLGGAGRHKTPP